MALEWVALTLLPRRLLNDLRTQYKDISSVDCRGKPCFRSGLSDSSLFPPGRVRPDFHRNLCIHIQPMRVVQQLLDAHLRNLAVQKIADVGLVLAEESGKLLLCVAPSADALEQSSQNAGLDP